MGMKRMGAAALIFDDAGRILLVKHTYGEFNWELPGGGSDDNESVRGTALRETWEETGLRVAPDKLIGLYYRAEIDSHDATYLCRSLDNDAKPVPSSPEIGECRYWPVDGLPRPISTFTELRIRHGVSGETLPDVFEVEPLKWLY